MKINLKVFTDKPFRMPTQATSGSAGWDVYSLEDIALPPGQMKIIPCGFGLEIPTNYYVSIVPRSSFGKKLIWLPNSPATIDSDYRGEIHVMLMNLGQDQFYIKAHDRIAQLILHQYNHMEFNVVDQFTQTNRGEGGFGSTGK